MSKKQSQRKSDTKKGTKNHVVIGLLLVLLALIAIGGMIGGAGVGGLLVAQGATWIFGAGSLLFPILLLTAGILIIRKRAFPATFREILTGVIGLIAL